MMMETKNTNIIKTYDICTHMFLILLSVNCSQGWKALFFKWMENTNTEASERAIQVSYFF